jgi:hypothetical protein
MQFFSVGQQAEGFIAIGQEATGVIAIGQIATGVIAIGQLARGVFAIGMLSTGLVSVGMLSLGVVYCVAMLGAGGRGVGMLLIPLCPKLPPQGNPPELARREELELGRASGWIAALVQRSTTGFGLMAAGQPLRVKLGGNMISAASQAFVGAQEVLAYVVPTGQGAEVTRLMKMPKPSWRSPQFLVLAGAQLAGLAIASVVYFWFGFAPVVDAVLAIVKD